MRIRNAMVHANYFPYAGVSERGVDLTAGQLSAVLPISRLNDKTLISDLNKGKIDILITSVEKALLGDLSQLTEIDLERMYVKDDTTDETPVKEAKDRKRTPRRARRKKAETEKEEAPEPEKDEKPKKEEAPEPAPVEPADKPETPEPEKKPSLEEPPLGATPNYGPDGATMPVAPVDPDNPNLTPRQAKQAAGTPDIGGDAHSSIEEIRKHNQSIVIPEQDK